VEQVADEIPFPSLDSYEFWLLDEHTKRPLALLDSALDVDRRMPYDNPVWHPGGQAGRQFSSDSGDAEQIARLIKLTAGRQSNALWIKRNPDGSGSDQQGRHYAETDFPALLLRDRWDDRQQQQLVTDFLNWQAPWLLQLPLCQDKRTQLETAAWNRPFETSRVYRLFPEIIDQQGLITTRVKARIMQDKSASQGIKEPFYPFVNE
jgi:hypothetical protein